MPQRKTYIYSHNSGSRSAATLAQALGVQRIRHNNSRFRGSNTKTIINWGSSNLPDSVDGCFVINRPEAISTATNKRTFFEACAAAAEDVRPNIPPFTVDKNVAAEWLQGERPRTIFARTVLQGHSGEGIVKVTNMEELEAIRAGTLLVQYVPKRREFRLHVSRRMGVFSVQEKLKRRDIPNDEIDYQIRNHDNGFVFARDQVQLPEGVEEQARRALAVTDLDFGAVDLIYQERTNTAYVLEVNTAPGLEGTTAEHYQQMLEELLNA